MKHLFFGMAIVVILLALVALDLLAESAWPRVSLWLRAIGAGAVLVSVPAIVAWVVFPDWAYHTRAGRLCLAGDTALAVVLAAWGASRDIRRITGRAAKQVPPDRIG